LVTEASLVLIFFSCLHEETVVIQINCSLLSLYPSTSFLIEATELFAYTKHLPGSHFNF